ncbi:rod-binding protein [Albimonas pacifica]|uniref:Rod binding protein n=1 Tax=Albimonas pacifica TaxID=1114924 RepID=A0A1I3IHZ2_9RHOB|nr:rod-binding protein [Albimonas pacifica]SFI47532.1 Rod binding protein [Albimonas pacifica]
MLDAPSAVPLGAGATTPDRPIRGSDDAALRKAAVEFETMFLAEALSAAGLGRPPEGFGGGVGEQAFTSLLVREQARLLAESGGIGLAERIYRSLIGKTEAG